MPISMTPSMMSDPYVEIQVSGGIRIRGTRVGIEQIAWAYLDGSLAEEIAIEYPTVSLDQVHGAIAYYLRHRPEVDVYLAELERTARVARVLQASQTPTDVIQRLRQLAMTRTAQ
jgi:uncharacterized protein (DUF433 family)